MCIPLDHCRAAQALLQSRTTPPRTNHQVEAISGVGRGSGELHRQPSLLPTNHPVRKSTISSNRRRPGSAARPEPGGAAAFLDRYPSDQRRLISRLGHDRLLPGHGQQGTGPTGGSGPSRGRAVRPSLPADPDTGAAWARDSGPRRPGRRAGTGPPPSGPGGAGTDGDASATTHDRQASLTSQDS
jgi:hypothetical protein